MRRATPTPSLKARRRSHRQHDSATDHRSRAKIASGELRAERLTEDALATIAELQPSLNAFITIMADSALEEARRADKEIAGGRHLGPLHGVPISIKDLIDVAGVPTTAASKLRAEHVAHRDAPVVTH